MLRDNLFLASLGLLILLVLVILGLVLYFAVRRSAAKPGSDPKIVKMRFDSLRSSFRQAVELIEGNIASRSERYSIPWVLVLNEGNDNRQLPIEQSGVASALSSEAASAAAAQGISWHFFDKGIVIDMQGAYLGSPDDEDAAEKPWDEFLGLCRKYRPQRPFDSVVITVPASLLLDSNPDALLELGKLARLAHRRLWLAQNRFAMRFAVYVLVSGCDQIEGFSPFARALPEPMRAGILGWSSPYDLSTTYQDNWVGDALDSVVKTVSDTSAELFALDSESAETSKFFLLPSRIDAIRAQLQLYVDELMRPSAYHEPFFFRGIYLTGDSSESAQKAGVLDIAAALEGETPEEQVDLVSQLMREPAFLRDLFEKKIFMEYGVARPSRQQLSRPVLSRAARWGAVVLLGGWSVGLLVATVQLGKRNPELARALTQIESDANYRTRASERGEAIPSDWYRAKTLSLLAAIEKLGTDKAWTFFMPGSWYLFDDLDERVAERIEREFGEIAINTLRRELYARAADMTGVSQDPSTGELIIGGECAAPAGFQAIAGQPRKASLSVEDLPEFSALLQYLTGVERLDQAIVSMVRLQKPSPNEANDLRLLVKYTLGAELPGNISQSIRFFRGSDAPGSISPAAISVMHIQQAARCSLGKGVVALDQRLFSSNDLLVSERQLVALNARLFSPDARINSFSQTITGYREVLAAIKEQESLLATGKGGWMRQSTLNLGPAYDAALIRITQSRRLLGPESAEQARQHAVTEFQKFSAEFYTRFGVDGQSGIVWQDKEARFTLSADRLALRDALTGLLSQPFMTPPSDREVPEIVAQSILVWDTTKLDQALALSDAHKRFMSESLVKFPPAARPSVGAFVNFQFARLVSDQAIDALSISGRTDPGAVADAMAFDASRGRLIKVQGLLTELGAKAKADNLRSLISQDALARLRQVDDSLNQSDLYAIRGRDFSYWLGDRGPLLQAFGVADAPGLLQTLALQFSRAETLGKQSEIYLASLDGAAAESQLARRWQAINRELERYRLKNPNSSLVVYEQFLVTVGADLDRANCSEKLAGKSPGGRPADYFAEKHLQVYNALVKRCNELRVGEQQEQWASFSGSFNRLLAGRHPFALPTAKDAQDADFDDVGQVLKSSERMSRIFKDTAAASRNSASGQAARRFIEQLDRVRAFMAPLYPVEEGAVAGYDMAVEFRTNQSLEVEGNKVIDWTLEVGSQTLKLRDPPRPLRWEPGNPITLTLRLAKDSPVNAMGDLQQPQMFAEGKTVSYRFADAWALIRMIQRQREPDAAGRADGRSQLLRMEFPMVFSTDNPRQTPQEVKARVYMRISLSPVGKRTPVFWPGVFPTRAPEFAGQ
ncbi:MAG: type VI secretion system protein [Polaromonas sp.]|nr:type VI secretion system protein [Polaromonas sp.]